MSVYFIQAGVGGPVKIGFAEDIRARLSKMRSDNHEHLLLLAVVPGNEDKEAAYHARFAQYRLRGEWFRPAVEIILEATNFPVSPGQPLYPDKPLGRFLHDNNLTLTIFAERIDRSAATVSRIARGEQRPDWATIEAIRLATNGEVEPNDFFEVADTRPCDTEAPDAAA